ncbi:MAG TPA: DUF3667 domain-containing protein [Saprospiraceae bacterium]|nr:DUF3667 domain-containing protein [Saprospiraceae bacterium]
MTNSNCLNCGKKLTDKFCSGCGQKADTKRITFKNLLYNDVIQGVFNLELGILYTAKQAILRPGQAALDYIAGKRKRFYNIFYLILLTIGALIFTNNMGDLFVDQSGELVTEKEYLNEASEKLDKIISQKRNIILFLFVPFAAFNSLILFRKKKLNLSEHSILSGMILLGILLLSTLGNIYFPLNNFLNFSGTIASLVITVILIIYISYGYFNAFSGDYSIWGITYRIILFFALLCLEVGVLFFLVFGYVSDWKFGEVSITPFG